MYSKTVDSVRIGYMETEDFTLDMGAMNYSIELGVSEENTSAIEFYRAIGMTTKSRKMEIILNYHENKTSVN
ncbi:N-acetyltransferase [Bacillus solitudinis]|uniref:hypothetical protein n=1 Tax=Bacillus solitudinis TaxID=2014074 RepID=UPI000C233438|nr:hypothetical protein [Bacillus solitudinis]